MNDNIRNVILFSLIDYQNKNLNKPTHLYKIKFYKQKEFNDILKSDVGYIEDFISCIKDEETIKYLQDKINLAI